MHGSWSATARASNLSTSRVWLAPAGKHQPESGSDTAAVSCVHKAAGSCATHQADSTSHLISRHAGGQRQPAGRPAAAAAPLLRAQDQTAVLSAHVNVSYTDTFQANAIQVASVSRLEDLPPPLRRCFGHEIELPAPDRAQRRTLLAGLLGGTAPALDDTALDEAAAQTAGADAAFCWKLYWLVDVAELDPEFALPRCRPLGCRLRRPLSGMENTRNKRACVSSLPVLDVASISAGMLPADLRAVTADAAAAAAADAADFGFMLDPPGALQRLPALKRRQHLVSSLSQLVCHGPLVAVLLPARFSRYVYDQRVGSSWT